MTTYPRNRYRQKASAKDAKLDIEVYRRYREGTEVHEPDRPEHGRGGGRGVKKWGCTGCDYWTGYESRAKANRMILAHCNSKNAQAICPATDTRVALASGQTPTCRLLVGHDGDHQDGVWWWTQHAGTIGD